jgi:hypothetical protein
MHSVRDYIYSHFIHNDTPMVLAAHFIGRV